MNEKVLTNVGTFFVLSYITNITKEIPMIETAKKFMKELQKIDTTAKVKFNK